MQSRFEFPDEARRGVEPLDDGACVLRGFALDCARDLHADAQAVIREAPMRHLVTPGGYTMSVAMTNCGALGWVSDRRGYRYAAADPDSGRRWPPMPATFRHLAQQAAGAAGFSGYAPDACLINRYVAGARLSLHCDQDERDPVAPIVSVSLGVPAMFLWGGPSRTDKTRRLPLLHGDVVVWGGPARHRYHGVAALKAEEHPLLGACRLNLTFRKVY